MGDKGVSIELPAWAGPALFSTVLVVVTLFFLWFLKA